MMFNVPIDEYGRHTRLMKQTFENLSHKNRGTRYNLTQLGGLVCEPFPKPSCICLLRHEYGTESDMLEFSMITVDLEPPCSKDFLQYRCLSYAWGDPRADCLGF